LIFTDKPSYFPSRSPRDVLEGVLLISITVIPLYRVISTIILDGFSTKTESLGAVSRALREKDLWRLLKQLTCSWLSEEKALV
jgi:hypothetical protein